MMADKPMSMFGAEAAKRQLQQAELESKLLNKSGEASDPKEDPEQIIRINVSLPKSYKDRLTAFAKKKSMPVSVLIRTWIDENCD